MFSSGAHEMLVDTIYDCHLHGPECYGCAYERTWTRHYYPSNAVNHILKAARVAPGADIYWSELPEWPTLDEQAHAQAVLTRLARMRELYG